MIARAFQILYYEASDGSWALGAAARGELEAREIRLESVLSAELALERLDQAVPEGEDGLAGVLLALGVGEDAFQFLARVRARHPHLPIVVLGPQAAPELQARAQREGANEYTTELRAEASPALLIESALRHAVDRARLVAELERARRLGLHLAHHDTLTDLPNRQLFRTRLRQLIAQARRSPSPLAVFFLDLDRFKQINDTLGHAVGDLLLQDVARRISSCVRETDLASRRGGDEFTLILDGITRGQDAAKVAKKVLSVLSKPFLIDGHELFVGVSIGISLFPTDGNDVDTLVKHADIAMYRAKGRGGNNYQFYLPEMNERALERMELEHSLHQAIERGQFVVHYQPQVDLITRRIVCMEALVRWQHPDLGLIYPDDFIPLAEETGLIVPLGEWVLESACAQAKAWQNGGLEGVPVAVNFSARQFQYRRPVERLKRVLARTGLDPCYLDLELTESAVMKDPSFAIETLRALREMGVSIAIDDFGTGHSSLSYLKRFPITKLKIDKVFIRTLLLDPKDAAITQAIIGMAHNLKLKAVAEGVENLAQLEFLGAPGCDEVQGYLFSKPLPVAAATALLQRGLPMYPERN